MRVLDAINPAYWINRMIDNRIFKYGKGVGTEMKYNPLLTVMQPANNDKLFTRRMLENSTWYSGNEQDLAYFYTKEAPNFYRRGEPSESMNYFWANRKENFRKIHSGFPQLISEKMVDLIVGNGYTIKVEGSDEIDLQDDLDAMLEDNKFATLLGKSIETESWSGGVSWKITFNPQISEFPIIEMWQPENYTNSLICGRVVEDIFYRYYDKNNVTYRLSEIYGVDDTVGAYIDYKLEQLQMRTVAQQEKEPVYVEVPLSTLEQTQDLGRIEFRGYFRRLSLYKPNKLPNSEFRYSYIGESDYAGSYGAFDAVDEIISTWVQEFRDGKLNRYFPEEYMQRTDNQQNFPDDFKKDHIVYADSPSENVDKQKIIYAQGEVRTDKHRQSYEIWVQQIINNAGLSPMTVGLLGLESIDASAESQQEREKVSIRTRNKKIELWVEFLQDIIKTALDLRVMTKNMTPSETGVYNVGTVPEYDLIVAFEDYIIKSKRDRTNETAEGLGVSWDILESVKYVHDEKTLAEQLAMSARIKIEQGIQSISQAELSALDNQNQQDNEKLVDDDVPVIAVNQEGVVVPTDENDTTPPTEDQ